MTRFASSGLLTACVLTLLTSSLPTQAQAPRNQGERPPATVVVAPVERKSMPVRIDATGTVQGIASVTIRSRVDSQIMEIGFQDGATVKAGDLLFRLDSRQLEAQVRQAQASIAKDQAQLALAIADQKRAESLARSDFASEQRLETARAQVASLRASVDAGQAALDGLKVQLSYYTIEAPITGRTGVAGARVGSIVRSAEGAAGGTAQPLATITQMSPIYVSFAVPQRYLPDLREALTSQSAKVQATPQGFKRSAEGSIALIDNSVDPATGTIGVRATFLNDNELLWPGALCDVRVTLRVEPNAVTVPREAVQTSQTGSLVFVVDNGVARVRPVTVSRLVDRDAVISSGLSGGETVVTDGQLLLTDGAKVVPRNPQAKPEGAPATANQSPARSGT